jgi:hypothetical protein
MPEPALPQPTCMGGLVMAETDSTTKTEGKATLIQLIADLFSDVARWSGTDLWSKDSALMEAVFSTEPAAKRIREISGKLRQIAKDLEAGKEVAPKKITHLAGSLDYWLDKIQKAALSTALDPMTSLKACYELLSATEMLKRMAEARLEGQGGAA